jgi:hypothetical protein
MEIGWASGKFRRRTANTAAAGRPPSAGSLPIDFHRNATAIEPSPVGYGPMTDESEAQQWAPPVPQRREDTLDFARRSMQGRVSDQSSR